VPCSLAGGRQLDAELAVVFQQFSPASQAQSRLAVLPFPLLPPPDELQPSTKPTTLTSEETRMQSGRI
jgi:hypothetical protein